MKTGDRGVEVFTDFAHAINGMTEALREQNRVYEAYPAWHEEKIAGPLIACGLPRCDKQLELRRFNRV
jgi:hypothetical protein